MKKPHRYSDTAEFHNNSMSVSPLDGTKNFILILKAFYIKGEFLENVTGGAYSSLWETCLEGGDVHVYKIS